MKINIDKLESMEELAQWGFNHGLKTQKIISLLNAAFEGEKFEWFIFCPHGSKEWAKGHKSDGDLADDGWEKILAWDTDPNGELGKFFAGIWGKAK